MLRRHVHNDELVLVAFAEDMTERGTLRSDRQWHIFRQTVNGNRIGACDTVKERLESGFPYYAVPFKPFLADAIQNQICFWCGEKVSLTARLEAGFIGA